VTEAQKARLAMRNGEWTGPTVYKVPGFVQTNLVVLPQADAYDFVVYCQRNPKPCPLIDITDPGDPTPRVAAPEADLRTDLPQYAVYRKGVREKNVTDIRDFWRKDSVGFLIGSSLSFDDALEKAGVPKSKDVWVLNTTIPSRPAGKFKGPVVVTMRWMTPAQAVIACQLTGRFPYNHGAPLHMGDPAAIGADLENPIVGEPVKKIPDGVMPVFWACGVTPQRVALEMKPELMITHAPGHAFITDIRVEQFCLP
jgi:uncharacterized protein YcsI (UPF0317 family)